MKLNCPTCGGSGKDPKKRTRKCPSRFCISGQIDTEEMCDCDCHDNADIRHAWPCCGYCYAPREEYEAVVAEAEEASDE